MINGDMPPGQQPAYPPAPPPQQGPDHFDFIMNPGAPQRRPLLGGGAPSLRLLAVVGGAIVLVIILFVVIGSLLGGGKGDTAVLTGIAEQQAEIARVATLATRDAASQDTQNFANNTALSVGSSEKTMVTYLGKNGVKVGPKTLLLKKDIKTDAALQAAKDSGTYDSTFVSLMQTQLTSYQTSVKAAYKAATGTTEKQVLNDAFKSSVLLLQQSKQHS